MLREVGHFLRQDAAQETQLGLNAREDEGIYQVVNAAIPSSPLESFASSTDKQSCQTPETGNGQEVHGPQGIQQDQQEILNDISNYLPVNPLLIDSLLITWAIS
jgi:hypothetical protein